MSDQDAAARAALQIQNWLGDVRDTDRDKCAEIIREECAKDNAKLVDARAAYKALADWCRINLVDDVPTWPQTTRSQYFEIWKRIDAQTCAAAEGEKT